jgi:pimeloyl-ACP methyl ester carboxylesterase
MNAMQETVVLVHGVLMTGKVMAVLARRLKGCGYRTELFDYPTRRHSMRDNARLLTRFIGGLGAGRVHLVGHSMGGMLILRALQDNPGMPPGRVVLMGTPVRGSGVAKRLYSYGPGRWLLGASAEGGLLEAVPDWTYGREIGVIAGDMPVGIGMALGGLSGRHDGTVGVAETCLEGATDTLVVNASHTSLVLSRRVAGQICNFLRQGHFAIPSPGG